MHTVNIHEAKTHFSRLIDSAIHGEETIIAKSGKPVAKLVPIRQEKAEQYLPDLKGKMIIELHKDCSISSFGLMEILESNR